MRFAFTEYVQSLEPDDGLESRSFDAAWRKLRDALVGELKRRALWQAPPSWLGFETWQRWSEPGALDELMAECFVAVFLNRLTSLRALARKMEHIEGLVFRNIRNFLFDAQKKHNPLDFRVFEMLRDAVRNALEAGTLHILAGDPKVTSATVLAFEPWIDPDERHAELEPHVRTWGDELLPELLTATPSEVDPVLATLGRQLAGLEEQGIEVFRFKDLAAPLQHDVKARWAVLWGQGGNGTDSESDDAELAALRLSWPDAEVEQRELFEKLLACVAETLPRRAKTHNTRRHLEKLWGVLCRHAEWSGDELPSRRRLGELLDIPRYRFPELYEILGHEVERCREALARPEAVP